MSANWGPAFDAEVAYRQEQVRAQFGRRPRRGRRRSIPAAAPTAVLTAARPTDVRPTVGSEATNPVPAIPRQREVVAAEHQTPVAAA